MTTKASVENRQTRPGSGAGIIHGVGCLPFLFALLLFDVIGKAVILGTASWFGKQMPSVYAALQYEVWAILTILAAFCVGMLISAICLVVSKIVGKFRKDGNDKKIEGDGKNSTSAPTAVG